MGEASSVPLGEAACHIAQSSTLIATLRVLAAAKAPAWQRSRSAEGRVQRHRHRGSGRCSGRPLRLQCAGYDCRWGLHQQWSLLCTGVSHHIAHRKTILLGGLPWCCVSLMMHSSLRVASGHPNTGASSSVHNTFCIAKGHSGPDVILCLPGCH